jgi:uncharacterized protein (DUF952 family)
MLQSRFSNYKNLLARKKKKVMDNKQFFLCNLSWFYIKQWNSSLIFNLWCMVWARFEASFFSFHYWISQILAILLDTSNFGISMGHFKFWHFYGTLQILAFLWDTSNFGNSMGHFKFWHFYGTLQILAFLWDTSNFGISMGHFKFWYFYGTL